MCRWDSKNLNLYSTMLTFILQPYFRVNTENPYPISELIFEKVATKIKYILRLSRLKEYASPENKTSIGFITRKQGQRIVLKAFLWNQLTRRARKRFELIFHLHTRFMLYANRNIWKLSMPSRAEI